MANPAHPKGVTSYAKALDISLRWQKRDLCVANLSDLQHAEASLRACGVTIDNAFRRPGKALLRQITAELDRRAANEAARAGVAAVLRREYPPAGSYSRALWAVSRPGAPRCYVYE